MTPTPKPSLASTTGLPGPAPGDRGARGDTGRLVPAGLVIGGACAALVLYFLDPARSGVYPVCLFHLFTGLDCPGCGSLRALHALLHGQWIAALRFNLMLVLSLPLFAWCGWRLALNRLGSGPAPAIRPLWIWLYGGAWIFFGIARNLPLPGCGWFAP